MASKKDVKIAVAFIREVTENKDERYTYDPKALWAAYSELFTRTVKGFNYGQFYCDCFPEHKRVKYEKLPGAGWAKRV